MCLTCKLCIKSKSFAVKGIVPYAGDEVYQLLEGDGVGRAEMSRAGDRHGEVMCIVAGA